MTDACTIARAAGAGVPVWNPATSRYDSPTTQVYAGKCRVKAAQTFSREEDAGGTTAMVIRPSVHIPADTVGVQTGDVVTVTSASHNPTLVSRTFRVSTVFLDSQATAQRLDCTEVQ